MRQGILRECIVIKTAGMGQLAIEDIETHRVELVVYELKPMFKALHRYQDKVVSWGLDEQGLLSKLDAIHRIEYAA